MKDEGFIDDPQILRIGRDDVPVALPCTDRNRDIDDIGVARPATEQTDGAGYRVVQREDLSTLVAEQRGNARLPRPAAPRLSNYSCGDGDLPAAPVDLV
jgi:hypothetical protein